MHTFAYFNVCYIVAVERNEESMFQCRRAIITSTSELRRVLRGKPLWENMWGM